MTKDELIDILASIEFKRWVQWQSYVHSVCEPNPDGSLTIPSHFAQMWEQRMKVPYSELPEDQKEVERKLAEKYWELLMKEFAKVEIEKGDKNK